MAVLRHRAGDARCRRQIHLNLVLGQGRQKKGGGKCKGEEKNGTRFKRVLSPKPALLGAGGGLGALLLHKAPKSSKTQFEICAPCSEQSKFTSSNALGFARGLFIYGDRYQKRKIPKKSVFSRITFLKKLDFLGIRTIKPTLSGFS